MHQREIIRHKIADLLGTIPSLAGRVFATRTRPTEAQELPVALIYTLSETSELLTINGDKRHTLTAAVELRVQSDTAADDALDDMCERVEAVMAADLNLGGTAFMNTLTGTAIGLDGEGETRQLLATLTYTVIYDTAA